MDSYNNTIIPKIVEYVNYIANRITEYDEDEREITLLNYVVVESEGTNIDKLRLNNLTESFEVHFKFEVKSKDGSTLIQTAELFIPKMINNVFIIEGKTRIPTSTLDNSSSVRIYNREIVINDNLKVPYSYNDKGELEYSYWVVTDEDTEVQFPEGYEAFEDYRKYLKLTKQEQLKLQIKLDLDNVGDELNRSIILDLLSLGSDSYRDNIIDKRINTTEENLLTTLYRRVTRRKILTNTRRKFYQYGIIYMTDIQSTITKFFRVANERTIEIPSKVNPLVFDSLRYKITLPTNVAYNETFTDLIDAINTPENTNVNRINELNVCCSVENGEMFIYCYKFDTGEKVKVPYLEYLNSIVLLNIHYDYDSKSIKDNIEYYYKLRQKEYKVKSLKGLNISYIEPKPDEKLSISTRRIPMINNSDSVRVAMGASMAKQAIEIENAEPRLIASGNDNEDYLQSSLSIKHNGNNPVVIESVSNNKIFYRDTVTGSIAFYTVEDPIIGVNDAVITFTSVVKEGDVINKGDLVISPSIMSRNSYDLGANTLIFYMGYMGYTYEDGIVISESYAKRLTHYSSVDVIVSIKPNDLIKYIKKIGSKVSSKDILVNLQTELRGRSSTNESYLDNKGVMNFLELKYNQSNLTVPNNIEDGYIVDVLIQQNPETPLISEYSTKIIEDYLKDSKVDDYDILPERYKKLKVIPMEFDSRYSCNITFKIIKVNPVKVGDKLSNSWGSKGIVSLILPDGEMPYRDSDKKIADMLLNPAAVISRKNPSQLYEVALTKIIREIYGTINHELEFSPISTIKTYLPKELYDDKFEKMTDEEFILNHKKGMVGYAINVGSYSKFNYEKLIKLMDEYGIKEDDEVTSPALGAIENPVITGESYIMKLYHAADYNGKVTSSVVDSNAPYMGKGNYRDEGQKIGEMEFWSLLAYGTENFIQDQRSDLLTSQYVFLNELLLAGYVMVDQKQLPYLSNYRKKLQDLSGK